MEDAERAREVARQAAAAPLPASDDEGDVAGAQAPAAESGGWGADFLSKNKSQFQAAQEAVAAEIEKEKGGGGSTSVSASAAPAFSFGAAAAPAQRHGHPELLLGRDSAQKGRGRRPN